jgi:hypothetical protein
MLSDTSPAAERVWIKLWREMPESQRLGRALSLSRSVIAASRAALAEAQPQLSPRERDLRWVEINYGRALAERLRAHLKSR